MWTLKDKPAEQPDNNPPPIPEPAAPAAPEGGSITYAQLLMMMKEFASELKKPDAETQAKLDAEREKQRLARERRLALIQLEENQKKCEQGTCSHTDLRLIEEGGQCYKRRCTHRKINGQPYAKPGQWGQRFTDGVVRFFCGACFAVVAQRQPTQDELAGGFGLNP